MTVNDLKDILAHCSPDSIVELDAGGKCFEIRGACFWGADPAPTVLLLTGDKISFSNAKDEARCRRPIPE